jgi:anthranilate phosphoribosyltransferase
MIRDAIIAAAAGRDLTEDEAAAAMEEMMTGEATPGQVGALLTALRVKGESVSEISGMARVMRTKSLHVEIEGPLLDTCGTGGAAFDPFNVSTAAAFVCAGAGVRVAKHGNRAATSASGSADVLEALGAKLDLAPEQVAACIEKSGVGFMFAQAFHPAMRFVGPVRREIGIRTIFNFLGPLTNPASAGHQLLGVSDATLAPKIAEVLGRLGTQRALVVHSEDGLDEVSLSAPTQVFEPRDGGIFSYTVTPEDAGLDRVPLEVLRSGTPAENATRLRAVLAGNTGPDRDFVLLNAGAALVAAGKAVDVKQGVALAAQSIDSGAAARALDTFVSFTSSAGAASS